MNKKNYVNINEEMEVLSKDVDKNFNRIVEINNPLIYKVIKSMKFGAVISFDDLYQESLIELYKTAKKFKKVSVNFTSYFVNNLKFTLIQYINQNQYILKLPYYVYYEKSFDDLVNYTKSFNDIDKDLKDCPIIINKDFTDNICFNDDRLNEIKENLTEEEWNMIVFISENSVEEYAKKKGVSKQTGYNRWNKIKKKIKNMK